MNLNTFSLMATAPSNVRGLKVSAFPETFLLGYTCFFLLKCWKVFTRTIFHRSFTTTNKNVNEKKARKKVYLKQQGMVRGTRLEMVSVKSVVLNLLSTGPHYGSSASLTGRTHLIYILRHQYKPTRFIILFIA